MFITHACPEIAPKWWDEIGKTNCVFMLNVTSFICKCHWSDAKKIRSYFRIPELSELWDQLVIFSLIKIMLACWPYPTDGIAIGKTGCGFTSNVLSVIRRPHRAQRVHIGKNISVSFQSLGGSINPAGQNERSVDDFVNLWTCS